MLDKQQFAIHGDVQWRFLKVKKSLSVNLGAFQTSSPATQRALDLRVWGGDKNWRGNGQLRLNVRVIGLSSIFILPHLKWSSLSAEYQAAYLAFLKVNCSATCSAELCQLPVRLPAK